MYRTEEEYYLYVNDKTTINLEKEYTIFSDNKIDYVYTKDAINKLLEEGNIVLNNTYKEYKTFIFCIYKIIGAFDLKIIFSPEHEEQYIIQTTEITCSIDQKHNINFNLINILEPEEETEEYANYERMQVEGVQMFEEDKSIDFNTKDLNLEGFLNKLN